MLHSLHAQADRLRAGEVPDYEMVEVLENIVDETRYLGVIVKEDGEHWPDQALYSANFFATKAVFHARNYIRNATTRTTATPVTMERILSSVRYATEKAEAHLESR